MHGRTGVLAVRPRHGLEHHGGIGDGPGHRAGVVEAPAQGDNAGAADAATFGGALTGSVTEKPWVKANASLFSANAGWFFLKAVLFLVVVLVAVAMLSAFFGSSVAGIFVGVLAVALIVVGLRRQRRRRARVPRW